MSLLEIILISIGLSMDCFAVAVSFSSNQKLSNRDILRTAMFFAVFQGAMPVIGWTLGASVKDLIHQFDHWIAFAILSIIGIKMILQSFKSDIGQKKLDIRRIGVLLSLSFATSIDALMTGITFGFIEVNILYTALIILLVTFLNTIIGTRIGSKTTFLPGRWAERIGGLVLIGIGIKTVIEHLMFP